jgi:uncharacterized cupredoxin-like copper-binding protein
MRSPRHVLLLLVLAMLSSFGLAACGDDDESSESTAAGTTAAAAAGESVVNVQLGEDGEKYFITVDKDTVQAGTTTFVIDNVGSMHHEMVIFKTDIDPAELPLTDEDKVDEEKAGLVAEAVYTTPLRGDEDHRIRDGRGVDYTVDLPPGNYVLVCNLAGHYAKGQYVAFTVEGDAGDTTAVTPQEPEAASPAAAEVKGTAVGVTLGEKGSAYFIELDKNAVSAGTTTFVIDNVGSMHHEMAIFKTDLAPGKLPLTDENKVDEEKAGLLAEAVYATPVRGDEDHRIRDGRGVNFTIDLEPGNYVLLCNLEGHYAKGQYIAFTVN